MAFSGIGVTLGDQGFDHRHHLGDIACRKRGLKLWIIGVIHTQSRNILVEPSSGCRGQLVNADPTLIGTRDDLVFHIGDIAHIGHVIRAIGMLQQPVKHIEHNHRPRIAQMCTVIDSGPTDIETHIVRLNRLELLFLSGLGIIERDGRHGSLPRKARLARAWQLVREL